MIGLRWTLGIVGGLTLACMLALVAFGNGYRSSWGASQNSPLFQILPVLAYVLILISLFMPEQRNFLHVTAVMDVLLFAASAWLCRETPFVGSCGIIYFGMWGYYYWLAVWAAQV